jgi:hypothetical protein
MAEISFWILVILCIAMLGHGFLVLGRYYEFPFMAAGIFLGFILPQIPGLIESPSIPTVPLNKTLLFSVACLAMCWIGWGAGISRRPNCIDNFSEKRLLVVAAGFSLIGSYFFYKFGHLSDEERLRGFLSGTAVAYLFFARLLTYGLAIALLCCACRPSKAALVIIAFGSAVYLERIVIAGRRGEAAEFAFLIALAFWFHKRWAAPRLLVAMALAFSIVGLLGAADYRQATYYNGDPDWSRVMEIDLSAKWDELQREGGPEMTNAVMAVDYTEKNMTFRYSLDTWNRLVFAYVPAQIFGSSFKESLTIYIPPMFERGYEPMAGSTYTGMADAFASFWYFGCLKFGLIAWVLGRIYASALHGNTGMQILYMLSVLPGMLSITHFTDEILIGWVHTAAFLIPALYFARLGPPVPLIRLVQSGPRAA